MSASSSLDIRIPIGGLFTVLGVMLTGYGLATVDEPSRYVRSLSVNVNLWWGLVMFAFGLGLLLRATFYRRRPTVLSAEQTPEGRRTEARERAGGLEQ